MISKTIFLILLTFALSFGTCAQSDTIPEIGILFDLKEARSGAFIQKTNLPKTIQVYAMVTESFRKRAPLECTFMVSLFKIILTDRNGKIKFERNVITQVDLSEMLGKITAYDSLTIEILEIKRRKSTGETLDYSVNEKFIFHIR